MRSRHMLKLLLLLLCLTVNLFAIDGKIRVFIKSNDTVYTSQKVTVSIELLTDAFSITDARITFPDSNKYIVQAPQSAAYLDKDEIDGNDWQLVHYDYEVYSLQAGKIEIPSVRVSFSASMGYGQPKKDFTLKSDVLHFDVKVPDGIKHDQFVLVTDHYMLSSEIKPEKRQLIVGDAIELNIIQKAQGVPDILLKPMVYKSNAMLRVYDKEPELRREEKGLYDVSRTDKYTIVASTEGNVTLAGQKRVWWNSKTKTVNVEKIPQMTFEILPDPQIAIDAQREKEKKLLLYAALSVLLLLTGYKLLFPTYHRYKLKRQEAYKMSEEGKFDILLNSLKKDDAPGVYRNFYQWLSVVSPELCRGGFSAIMRVQPSFERSLLELDEKMLDFKQQFNAIDFTKELRKLRGSLLETKEGERYGLPKMINPN